MDLRKRLLWGAGAAAIGLALAAGVQAQTATSPPQPRSASPDTAPPTTQSGGQGDAAIVVTGTRLAVTGFTTPTPVTSVGQSRIQALGQVSAQAALNDLPQLRPISTTANAGQGQPLTSAGGVFTSSIEAADLRGLNAVRTLTLIDGRRVVPALGNGVVDLNIIPSSLISHIDVVTGGASAAYGSDAVAGVVNVVLDTKLRGLRGQVDYGVSGHGDGGSLHLSVAGGTSIGDRFSIVGGVEYRKDDPIGDCFSRSWCTHGGIVGTVVSPTGVDFNSTTFGGVLIKPGAPATYLGQFNSSGALVPFNPGTPGGTYMLNGGPNGVSYYQTTRLQAAQQVVSAFTHAEYQATDKLKFIGEFSFANNQSTILTVPGAFRFGIAPPGGQTGALAIHADNPYLNPALAATIAGFPNQVAYLGKFITNSPNGNDPAGDERQYSSENTYRLMLGASGDLFRSFTWDAYYQFGYSDRTAAISNIANLSNILLASDPVLSGGQIVCRSTLTSPNNGCLPLNAIGNPTLSQALRNYIFGTENDRQTYQQQVAAVNVRGNLFHTWAGPAAVAIGYEHRYEAIDFKFQNLPNVLLQAGGFPESGHENIDEVYGEIGVPLLKDSPVGKSLVVDFAGREAHYDSFGWQATWKAGVVYDITGWLRLRATKSLDIRAPNLNERFSPQTSSLGVRPLVYHGVTYNGVPELIGGNPNLKPEISNSYTIGGVLQGRGFLSGARLSVDYYNIDIEHVIVSPPIDTGVVSGCDASSASPLCSLLTFSSGGQLTKVTLLTANLASLKTTGFDIEAQYRIPLEPMKWPGSVTLQFNGNYVDHFYLTTPGAKPLIIDYAGNTGTPVTNQGGFGVPHWLFTASLTYDNGPFGATLEARYVDRGVNDPTKMGPDGYCGSSLGGANCSPVTLNTVPSRVYFNLAGHYDLVNRAGRKIELFGVIDNLLDAAPPFSPGQYYTDAVYFDQIGRFFRFGVRFKY